MRRIRLKVAPKINPSVSRLAKTEGKPASSETVPLGEKDTQEGDEISGAAERIDQETFQISGESAGVTQESAETPTVESSCVTADVVQTVTSRLESPFAEVIIPCSVTSTEPETVVVPETPVLEPAVNRPPKTNSTAEEPHQNVSRLKSRFARARPNIEGAAHRVRTFSSTSESEDEGRRMQRTRHPSVSGLSKDIPITKAVLPKSPEKSNFPEDVQPKGGEKPAAKKVRYEKTELQLRKEKVVKKLKEGKVDKTQLTMFDLIYYNPAGNGEKRKTSRRLSQTSASLDGTNDIVEERLAEEIEMEETERGTNSGKENVEEDEEEESNAMPVPQVRVGADGQIILDEQSLVVETSEAKAKKASMQNAEVVYESHQGVVNYGTWRKRKRSNRWDIKETARFYRALSMLGTDFSLMESLFPGRTRFELKKKFKLEERVNRDLVDRVIRNQKPFDPLLFGDESGASDDDDDEVAAPVQKGSKTLSAKDKSKDKRAEVTAEESTEVAGSEGTVPVGPGVE